MIHRFSSPSPPLLAALALSLLLHAALLALHVSEHAAESGGLASLRVSVRAAAPAPAAHLPAATTPAPPLPAGMAPAPPEAVTRPVPRHAAAHRARIPAPAAMPAVVGRAALRAEQPHHHIAGRANRAPPLDSGPAPTDATPEQAARPAESAGTAGSAAAATGETTDSAAVATLGPLLVAAIQRQLRYPERARQRGQTGTAQLRFTLLPDGGIEGITIAGSSGAAALDEAAVTALRAVAPFAPARGVLLAPRHFEAPIVFRLDAASAW